ncbi:MULTISPECIES: RNA polymerase sigma factor [Tenacibaculum]|uniref:RNA polymerase sigma factor n=1 Tax=Tenacibaculum aiptasiae TaxID=426481 RepID=A0A7J5AT10_9FLAO|nr:MULTISPECIES: RNA polymerase sigma factor [Tenacibaculum]KAB1160783.1 RNA polymerase sigma factor [Tenacibaculum aiptasiae]MCF2874488.1 RNA polymerase sigma factor [Tenacibaculum sp. Cn5-1]MCF2934446.1 RNA polymerase sigma factor [Tenacibaculum sp. Cn5-34]MCG7510656.1 RNA polymerase sigma factor [Tenacibaculum sp. Cn5-46]
MNEADFINQLTSKKYKDRAFSKLLDLYQERLYWHIRKLVGTHENADDVLQNTFVRVYKSLANFKQQSSLHTWMYKIAYNESMRFIEKEKKKTFSSLQDVSDKFLGDLKDDIFFDGDEAQLKLQTVLSQLPENQKKVFYMKYYDNLKFREISNILNIKEGTVKTHYYGAVKYIESNITKMSYIEKIKA